MHVQAKETYICQTCNYASECVHYRNSRTAGTPILFCEDFDITTPLKVVEKKENYLKKKSSQSLKPNVHDNPKRMKGLCINCENRVSCQLPAPEGGVWYCEEYS